MANKGLSKEQRARIAAERQKAVHREFYDYEQRKNDAYDEFYETDDDIEPPRKSRKKTGKKKKQSSAARKFKKYLIISLLIAALILYGIYAYMFSGFESTSLPLTADELGISETSHIKGVKHIAVFGVDSYEEKAGRSDCTIILSVDSKHKQLKVTSVLRDSYLPIKGHGNDKLTHAYAYGGAELMLHTLNNNFNLDIDEYIVLNYKNVVDMIDALDGLDIEITEKERKEINRIAAEMDPSAETVEQTGLVHLTGLQATAFARIRKIDTETRRTARQRIVIQGMIDKALSKGKLSYPILAHKFLPLFETSLDKGEIFAFAFRALRCDPKICEYVVPSEADHPIGGSYDGFWCWRYDIDEAAMRLHQFLEEPFISQP